MLPLLIFLILGFLDLGRAVYYYAALSNAVREGTRYAIVNKVALEQINSIDSAQKTCAQQKAQQIASHDLDIWNQLEEYLFDIADTVNYTDLDVCVDISVYDNKYNEVAVNATYCFTPVTPGIAQVIGPGSATCPNGIDIIAASNMLVTPGSRTK